MDLTSLKQWARELAREMSEDRVQSGAAALAYYLMLSIFPAMIALLALVPYLPIPNLEQAIMDWVAQAMPGESASLFEGVVEDVVGQRRGGLLSFGVLMALWASSNGLHAIMQQLNATYGVRDSRPFWKRRGIALLLTLAFLLLVVGAFALVVLGGVAERALAVELGTGPALLFAFAAFRWLVILAMLLLAFALVYYFGPDVEMRFRVLSPGAILGVLLLVAASVGFRFYVSQFGNYSATYGGLGAVIVLLLWLYIAGLVLLVGSELNSILERRKAAA